MPETVLGFLTYLKNCYLRDFPKNSCLNVVCGNESADLDSVVSAISYAYFSYIKDPRNPIVPIVNIPRRDLELRRDIIWVLKGKSIPKNLLYFREDLKTFKDNFNCTVESILVDHNDPQADAHSMIDKVVGIIDHHTDLGLYKDTIEREGGPRIITTAGSCSSLVLNYWCNLLGPTSMNTMADAFPLCLGAALIDTSNFQFKVESSDELAIEKYKEYLPEMNFNLFYNQIRTAKDDIKGLSLRDVLKKDYKQFSFGKAPQSLKCGMASVVKSLEWLQNEYGEQDFEQGCKEFLKDCSQDILLILTSWKENDSFHRQIAIFAEKPEANLLCDQIIDYIKSHLELEPVEYSASSENHFKHFNQLNTSASRKQIAPCIEKAVKSFQA